MNNLGLFNIEANGLPTSRALEGSRRNSACDGAPSFIPPMAPCCPQDQVCNPPPVFRSLCKRPHLSLPPPRLTSPHFNVLGLSVPQHWNGLALLSLFPFQPKCPVFWKASLAVRSPSFAPQLLCSSVHPVPSPCLTPAGCWCTAAVGLGGQEYRLRAL